MLLVTGAGGFVGRHVVEEACAQGLRVRATDLPGVDLSWADALSVDVIPADLTQPAEVRRALVGVDTVAHIAAAFDLSLPREALLRINLNGSVNLIEAAVEAGVRLLVNCSTADTYGTHTEMPIREDFAQRPDNNYAFSKLMAEQAMIRIGERRGLPVTTLRPTLVYGQRAVYTAGMFCVLPILSQLSLGFFPQLIGGPLISTVHVVDLAGAVVHALTHPSMAGRAYNVADDDWQSLGEFFHSIAEPLGVRFGSVGLPVARAPLRWFCRLLATLPDAGLDVLNQRLQAAWCRVVVSAGLSPALRPRLDKGFGSYGLGDHAFDNARLKATGYELRFPHFAAGYRETVRWYEDRRWIPRSAFVE